MNSCHGAFRHHPDGAFRGGADLVANLAPRAFLRDHARQALFDHDGSRYGAAFGARGAEAVLVGEAVPPGDHGHLAERRGGDPWKALSRRGWRGGRCHHRACRCLKRTKTRLQPRASRQGRGGRLRRAVHERGVSGGGIWDTTGLRSRIALGAWHWRQLVLSGCVLRKALLPPGP